VFYTGALPNQQAIPAVDYLMTEKRIARFVLEGTDFVYPRTVNKVLEAYLKERGVRAEDISINYTPFSQNDWRARVGQIKNFGRGKKTAVISTLNGDANVHFYRELARQGVKPAELPVLALSVSEYELAGVDTKPFAGHLAASNYFQSIGTIDNEDFVKRWREFTRNPKRVANDSMEAHYIGFNMWVKAVEKTGTTDPDRVIDTLPGVEVPNLSGGISKMLPNHHITKPVFVGEVRPDGQFSILWKTPGPLLADAWSRYLPGSKELEADWVTLKCGQYNKVTQNCQD
jgi:urea transport system substrate-binding protein